MSAGPGPIALVGGNEWTDGCVFDSQLLEASGGDEVLVLPTAAAYEHPDKAVNTAEKWFSRLGARTRGLMVLGRADAEDLSNAEIVREASFIYLGGGSAMHLSSVLKASATWSALVEAWKNGAVIAGSSAGAMVLTDPMVDPRGGALTVGFGMIEDLAVIPHFGNENAEKVHRSIVLAAPSIRVVGIPERTALIRDRNGRWSQSGAGEIEVFVDGKPAGIEALPSSIQV